MIYITAIDEVFLPEFPRDIAMERIEKVKAVCNIDGEVKRLRGFLTDDVIAGLGQGDVVIGNCNIDHACRVKESGARLFYHKQDGTLCELGGDVRVLKYGLVNEPVVKRAK